MSVQLFVINIAVNRSEKPNSVKSLYALVQPENTVSGCWWV